MTGTRQRSMREWGGIFVRGMAMGVAEVVPGVSGGTIAFVSGIYDELVGTIAGLSRQSPLALLTRPLHYVRETNLLFLMILGAGMLVSVLAFARLVGWLLQLAAPAVWAFFFGLIAASVAHLVLQVRREGATWRALLWAALGAGVGLASQIPQPGQGSESLLLFFGGGMLAVSAWLLPAVSGSFMLLILGLYEPVLKAIGELHMPVLLALGGGCACGLLLFSRLLAWCLSRYRHNLLALLTGFMAGAMPALWPWREAHAWLLPGQYALQAGDPFLLISLFTMTIGALTLVALTRLDA
ncbi:MAG: DUF368 domain-containing protein [Pseudomonadales bacterium]